MNEPQHPSPDSKLRDDRETTEGHERSETPNPSTGFYEPVRFEPDLFEPDRALEDARAQLAGLLGGAPSERPSEEAVVESNHPAFELHRRSAIAQEEEVLAPEALEVSDTVRPEPLSESGLANADDLDTSFDELAVDPQDPKFETADDPRIPPDRSFFKIGEAAKITGVKPYVLRYWETEFSWIRPTKTSARQRLYRRQDLALILQIRRLRYNEQQTIAAVREALRADRGEKSDRGKKRKKSHTPLPRPESRGAPSGLASRELVMALADMRRSVMDLLAVVDD